MKHPDNNIQRKEDLFEKYMQSAISKNEAKELKEYFLNDPNTINEYKSFLTRWGTYARVIKRKEIYLREKVSNKSTNINQFTNIVKTKIHNFFQPLISYLNIVIGLIKIRYVFSMTLLSFLVILFLFLNPFKSESMHLLRDLKFINNRISKVESWESINSFKMLSDQVLMYEITQNEFDPVSIAQLEIIKDMLNESKSDNIDDIKFFLTSEIKHRESKNIILSRIQNIISQNVNNKYQNINTSLNKKNKISASALIKNNKDLFLYKKARIAQKNKNFTDAINLYSSFLKKNDIDTYKLEKRISILNAAYSYQNLQNFNKAKKMYNILIKYYSESTEAALARKMQWYLNNALKQNIKSKKIIQEAEGEININQKLELQCIYTRNMNYKKSVSVIDTIKKSSMDKKLINKIYLVTGFSYKQLKEHHKARLYFKMVSNSLQDTALFQIADTYKQENQNIKAIEIYKDIYNKIPLKKDRIETDKYLGKIGLFQAGNLYLNKMDKPEMALSLFNDLSENDQDPMYEYINNIKLKKLRNIIPLDEIKKIAKVKSRIKYGLIEGETMSLSSKTGGMILKENMKEYSKGRGRVWSENSHLLWKDVQINDTLTLRFDSKKTGKYKIIAYFTKSSNYGIFKVSINNKKVIQTIDLYNDEIISAPGIELGEFLINEKNNYIKILAIGTNKKVISDIKNRYQFGLDAIILKQVH